ncbi:MAG: 3-hydroxyacyl-CoA dehydrogenase family protein [Proteobacteria bacterium]|nr:3-hydroxyacyl-CoA dehydrogenase family protein [Pseudomonadota bacterium]MBU1452499.1 3-hydroxyacyl-CoA dehydrogenase family protein [Pseudomonadota bacterium]MBU2516535.1 3-hydroxyacyl-CoA dehydrogenase family protein [Pseudomonadota bacterium]
MSREIRNLAVVGTGNLGARIALQAAYYGYRVSTWDPNPASFDHSMAMSEDRLKTTTRVPTLTWVQLGQAAEKVARCAQLEQALEGADLVIEAIPENLEMKREMYARLDALAPAGAILATNSSSIPVSLIADATGRPELCVNTHFYTLDIGRNLVDVMGSREASPELLEQCAAWVRSIGCVPLTVRKQIHGFCFNRIWRAIKKESLHMWAGGYVDYQDIDRGWMIWSGMDQGPFGLMDNVGLDVVYDIEMSYYAESGDPKDHPPGALKEKVTRGELGTKSGRGFYSYPEPEYKKDGFLKK